MRSTFRRSARTVSEALVWYHFLPLHSPAGESWYYIFQSSGAEQITNDLDILVARMRSPRECLKTISRDMEGLRGSILDLGYSVPDSIRGVLEEAYRGAHAYLHYRQCSLDAADDELSLALQAVRETLLCDASLLTYSLKNLQLITNRARIARRRGDWPCMTQCLTICERMLAGDAPLHCGGTSKIYLRDVCSFFQGIEPVDDLDAEALKLLADHESLAKGFRYAIASVWNSLQIANDY
jgi:hypothetical protein